MKRADLLLTDEQVIFLSELPGTISEHIRRAIDDYTIKMRSQSASNSPSKKGGK